MPPLVSLLTDFGTRDPFVAICKGVILSIAPDARLLDVTHEIDPFDVLGGSIALADVLPQLPIGVHMAVVDPGVGGDRRAIGIRTARGDTVVGPDNGLLVAAAERLGGIAAAHELLDPRYRRSTTARTFHGRDIFAPAAGHLAQGVALEAFGPAVARDDLVEVRLPAARDLGDLLRAAVVGIDRFGNLALSGARGDLESVVGPVRGGDALVIEWWTEGGSGRRAPAMWAETFGDAPGGETLVFEDSLGRLSIAINQGSAAGTLGIGLYGPMNLLRAR